MFDFGDFGIMGVGKDFMNFLFFSIEAIKSVNFSFSATRHPKNLETISDHTEITDLILKTFQKIFLFKGEIFVAGIFAQIRPIWLGYLVTRPKNPKKLRLRPYNTLYFPRFLFKRCIVESGSRSDLQ
jgi:hypothetical protein